MVTSADIKTTRDALKEDQAEFAVHFGVNQSTIHRWETKGPPTRGLTITAIERVMADLKVKAAKRARAA